MLADAPSAAASRWYGRSAAVAAYHGYDADRIVAETNQGGDMVLAVIRQVDENVPVEGVRASRGKWMRAEPVAALYAQGRVRMPAVAGAGRRRCATSARTAVAHGARPDRLDALVWALTELMLTKKPEPGVWQL